MSALGETYSIAGSRTVKNSVEGVDLVSPDALFRHFALNQLLVRKEVDSVA